VTVENLVFQGLIGLSLAMYLWLVSAGLTLAFGVLGVLNFAHGSLYMVGAYLAYTLYGRLGFDFGVSVVLAVLTVGALGAVMERLLFRPMYRLDTAFQLILTFGLVLIFSDLAKLIWGGLFVIPPVPAIFQGTVPVLGRSFPVYNIFVIAAGILVALGMGFVLERTWWGKTVRAAAADREMAAALGLNISKVFVLVFAAAAMLAGLGGAFSIPVRVVDPGTGTALIVQAFIITVIGGLGNLRGAFVGSLLVGVLSAYGTLLFPVFELFIIYLLMAVVLLIKPEGLFGR
jgi:branched-subunit amino acid ABC-type transport system permease component